jgi:hypothetical protein
MRPRPDIVKEEDWNDPILKEEVKAGFLFLFSGCLLFW